MFTNTPKNTEFRTRPATIIRLEMDVSLTCQEGAALRCQSKHIEGSGLLAPCYCEKPTHTFEIIGVDIDPVSIPSNLKLCTLAVTVSGCDPYNRCGSCWPGDCFSIQNYTLYKVKEYGEHPMRTVPDPPKTTHNHARTLPSGERDLSLAC